MIGPEITKENGQLIVRGGRDFETVRQAVCLFVETEIKNGSPCLLPSEVEQAFLTGKRLTWHADYNWEAWCDGRQPLEIIDVWTPSSLSPNTYIGYRCSHPECHRCKSSHSKWSQHFKILRPNGLDHIGKGVEVEIRRGKKRESEMVLVDQPVFVLARGQP